ncbi:unnamed protein product [Paramecium octaurelia]|uniref:TLDc domain-containing protein n=1 Tax=Paramecium octaurelia TaxID=43137 RepID=A0A8S1VTN5_PAROT|nr:unnamed protein product [Paramecium octaurelia]
MENLPFCQTLNFLRSDNSELICGSCLLELAKTQKDFKIHQIIDLEQIRDHPDQVFQFTNVLKFLPIEESQITKFFEDQKQQLNGVIQIIEQLINYYESMKQDYFQQWTTNFCNIIKYDEFKQILKNLYSYDKNGQAESIQQAQKQFQNYFNQIRIIDLGVSQKDLLNLQELHKYIYNKTHSNELFQEIINAIAKTSENHKVFFKFGESGFFYDLIKTIQEKVKKNLQTNKKIYHSIEHGLNYQLIKNKIIGEENLLWYFKSSNKNGQVFGGFTPYKWQIGYSGLCQENPSFLFSQTLREIYPIKQQMGSYTQYFTDEYLLFGGTSNCDQDLRINPDFKSGYSRLGIVYNSPDGIDTSKYSSYLMGALEPNVQECEIYQMTFE